MSSRNKEDGVFLAIYRIFFFRFFKAARVGETIEIDAQTLRRGKRLAFLSVDIRNKEDGVLLAQGKHTKFVG